MNWYIPSWNGDFRFVPHEEFDDRCALVVTDPTSAECENLREFGKIAVKAGWTEHEDLDARERTALKTPLHDAAAAMGKILGLDRPGVITALVSEAGRIVVTEAVPPATVVTKIKEAAGKIKAAVTAKRPTLSCPECAGRPEKARRACDVLWEFLDQEQRQEWLRGRFVTVFGGRTGHCYRVSARDTQVAKHVGRCILDLDDWVTLHCYDWSVPAEEELLAMVLILRFREDWLRVVGEVDPLDRARHVFVNPLPMLDSFIEPSLDALGIRDDSLRAVRMAMSQKIL